MKFGSLLVFSQNKLLNVQTIISLLASNLLQIEPAKPDKNAAAKIARNPMDEFSFFSDSLLYQNLILLLFQILSEIFVLFVRNAEMNSA